VLGFTNYITLLLCVLAAPLTAQTSEVDSRASSALAPIEIAEDRLSGRTLDGDPEGGLPPGGLRVEMQNNHTGSISRDLSQSIGLSFARWGTDEAAQMVSLRGHDPHQTRFFINGFPVADAGGTGMDTRWLQPRWLSHAQVLPQGDPSKLWHEALGGAINLNTDFADEGNSKNSIRAVGGSFGTRALGAGIRQKTFGLQVDARLSQDNFAFRDAGGTLWDLSDDAWAERQNNGWWRVSLLPWAKLAIGSSTAKIFWLGGWEGREVPGQVGTLGSQNWAEQFHLVGLSWNSPPTDWTVDGYIRYRDSRLSNLAASRSTSFAGVPGESREFAGGLRANRLVKLTPSWKLRAILGADQQSIENRILVGNVSFAQGQKQSVMATLVLQSQWPFENNLLLPLEWNGFSPVVGRLGYSGQPARQLLLLSPRWNFVVPLAPMKLHGAAGFVQRAPGLTDLFGDSRGLSPNPALAAESAWKSEVGLSWAGRVKSGQWLVTTTSSWDENRDLLVRVSSGPNSAVVQNIGRSRIVSQELATKFTSVSGWTSEVAGQYLYSQNLSDVVYQKGRDLPFRPRIRARCDVEKRWGNWSAGYLWQWQSGFFADSVGAKSVHAFQEHSLRARYLNRALGEWIVEMNNLFDTTVVGAEILGQSVQSAPTGLAGFPYPGRRIYVTWNYDW
jgi:iron complex outermembrane recepter protein